MKNFVIENLFQITIALFFLIAVLSTDDNTSSLVCFVYMGFSLLISIAENIRDKMERIDRALIFLMDMTIREAKFRGVSNENQSTDKGN